MSHPVTRSTRRTPRQRSAGRLRRAAAALALSSSALLTLGALAGPAPASAVVATGAGARAVGVPASFDAQVLAYTNAERRHHGLRPLAGGSCLDGFARRWTSHMAATGDFSHQSLRPLLRSCPRRTVGENIAWTSGSVDARRVVRMWMASAGHRHNILSPRYRYIGIDAFRSSSTGRLYVTQDFGG